MIEERGGGGGHFEGRWGIRRPVSPLHRACGRGGLAEVPDAELGTFGPVVGNPARALLIARLCVAES
jgi:hypothetical protein